MLLYAFFTDAGAPKTGLSATITVWKDDGTVSVNAQAMSEIAGGWYKYDFTTYDATNNYVIRADGSSALTNPDRYKYASNEVDAALADYDGPTKTELDSAVSPLALQSTVTGLNNLSQTQAQAAATAALNAYDPPTKTELDSAVTSLKGVDETDHTNLSDEIATRTTLGAGAITWTYSVTNSITGLPIADVNVWVTTDVAGSNVIASGNTNQNGTVTFYLDAGTIYVWCQKTGYDFTNPDTEVVS